MKAVFHGLLFLQKSMLASLNKACFNVPMLKTQAIELLGGTAKSAAAAIGVTSQAISGWPEQLTPALRDRVQAALYRQKATRAKPRKSKTPATA